VEVPEFGIYGSKNCFYQIIFIEKGLETSQRHLTKMITVTEKTDIFLKCGKCVTQ
jgi:hypothetical protein